MGNCTSSLETIPIPGIDGPLDETSKGLLMRALNSKEETEENMRKLIASNVDVNHKIEYESIGSCYPLHIACKVGNANAVDLLLKGGANPNLTDSQGKTPLHWAISEEHPDVIDELLQAKPDVNIASLDLMTPLNLAVKKNDSDVVQKLLNAGASVSPEKGEHPLVYAVKGQHVQVIMTLLRGNASPVGETFEFPAGKPATMLVWAEGNNYGEIATFLKQKFPEDKDENDKREGGDGAEDTAIPDEGGPPPDTAETVAKDGCAPDDDCEENDDQCGTCDEPDCGGEEHADEGVEAHEEAEDTEALEDTEAPEDAETQVEEEEAAAEEEEEEAAAEEAPTEDEAAAEEEAVIDGDAEVTEVDDTSSKGDGNEDTPDGGGRVVTDV